jgi:hypothetical protein
MSACIACGHDWKYHAASPPPGCGLCDCELTERAYTRAEVLAFGERVATKERNKVTAFVAARIGGDSARDVLLLSRTCPEINLAALLDGEGT